MAAGVTTAEQRERTRVKMAKWRDANPERAKAASDRSRKKDPEKRKASVKKWREKNKERHAAYQKKYQVENLELFRIHAQNRRALHLGSKLSKGLMAKLMALQKGKCACCHIGLKEVKVHMDHIMPLALGGSNDDSNIQLLCQGCNQVKHAKHPVEFMQSRGMLL